MIDDQHHHPANESDQDTPEVETGYAMSAENAKYNAANDSSYNAEKDIAKRAFPGFIHDAAREITTYQANYNPRDYAGTFVDCLIVALRQCWRGK
jgi:hypothetical protein